MQHVPALSATVYNHQTKVLVHPRDLMILMAACEEHAHVIQAWGGHLFHQMNVENIHEVTRYDALSVETFEDILNEENGNKLQALLRAVRVALGKALVINTSNDPLNDKRLMSDYYYDLALGNFNNGMNLRFNNGKMQEGLQFVRLEPEDVLAVFSSFGLESVVEGERGRIIRLLDHGPVLKPATQKLLSEIETRIGTPYSKKLPTFQTAVGDRTLFAEKFIKPANEFEELPAPMPMAV